MSARLKFSIPVAALALLACAQQNITTAPVTQVSLAEAADSIPLRVGKPVLIASGPRLTLSRVVSDSRCPRDVVCVWAGDAVVEIVADPPCYPACLAPSVLLTLHTNLDPRQGDYFGFTIRLLGLQPDPLAGKPIDQSQYVAWVRATRTSQ